MEPYTKFRPTGLDQPGLNADESGLKDFDVLLTQNRDSEAYERSNFRTAVKILGGEGENVQIDRFGHWACGWFETLSVRRDTAEHSKAEDIERKLADYPILDEFDASDLEYQENTDAGMILDDRGEWVFPSRE